ncbi:MAG: uracil-DNA glycosylase [Gammaproteobacteria bacterium]|nr:uracil-DNA glycosylase [Gammaproteobacteria bacterium]
MKRFPRRRLQQFIARLAARPNRRDSFNPYREPPLARNLEHYLETLWRHPHYHGLLLVGEALGYKGGRNTGVPFSSSKLYTEVEHPFLQNLAGKLRFPQHNGPQDSEATAKLVWRYLQTKQQLPLFWNAFPFHPHITGKPSSNRKPRALELEEGAALLCELVAISQPQRIAGIGREGHKVAAKLFPEQEVTYIRHPSYGGKADFISGMNQLLDCPVAFSITLYRRQIA